MKYHIVSVPAPISDTSGFIIVTDEDCRREQDDQEKLFLASLMSTIILGAKGYYF
jgi:DUF2075 family protein